MTEKETKALELIKKFEDLKEQMKKVSEEMETTLTEIGVGKMFQDPQTKIVYKVEIPEGQYVFFKKINYLRTKKESERQGSLSKKEAECAGFLL